MTGKLPAYLLKEFIKNSPSNEYVIRGPEIGFDAAKINTNNKNLIIASDPITFQTENIGRYSVYINANDIAVSGAIPKFFMCTLLLPPNIDIKEVKFIFNEVKKACNELDIALIGGHTEYTDSVNRPVISGTMFGFEEYILKPERTIDNAEIVLINKPCIEGTSILAHSGEKVLLNNHISIDMVNKAKNLLNTQGICVLSVFKEILELIKKDTSIEIYYMHDPTEGGMAGALDELSSAIDKGINIDNIKFMEETIEFCKVFNLDPMGLISSGSLLLVTNNANKICSYLSNYYTKIIGTVNNSIKGVQYKNNKTYNFKRDEIARFFEENLGD